MCNPPFFTATSAQQLWEGRVRSHLQMQESFASISLTYNRHQREIATNYRPKAVKLISWRASSTKAWSSVMPSSTRGVLENMKPNSWQNRWYTTMVGKKKTLKRVLSLLRETKGVRGVFSHHSRSLLGNHTDRWSTSNEQPSSRGKLRDGRSLGALARHSNHAYVYSPHFTRPIPAVGRTSRRMMQCHGDYSVVRKRV